MTLENPPTIKTYSHISKHNMHFANWFEFGINPSTGNVDVSWADGDVVTDVEKEFAIRLIALRDKFLSDCEKLDYEFLVKRMRAK